MVPELKESGTRTTMSLRAQVLLNTYLFPLSFMVYFHSDTPSDKVQPLPLKLLGVEAIKCLPEDAYCLNKK